MSTEARAALAIAVRLNPEGARQLYAVLRTTPSVVKRKADDPFGPLGMMVVEAGPEDTRAATKWRRPALPQQFRQQAAAFRDEWLASTFTKAELADTVEACLRQRGEIVPPTGGRWEVIRPRQ